MVNGIKEDELTKEILEFFQKQTQYTSTQDIAEKLTRPWHSIQTRCLRLQIEGKVEGFRAGRVNLWKLK